MNMVFPLSISEWPEGFTCVRSYEQTRSTHGGLELAP